MCVRVQYRIGRLELENMELEQSRIVHESMMKGKDLTIQKVLLQVGARQHHHPHAHAPTDVWAQAVFLSACLCPLVVCSWRCGTR